MLPTSPLRSEESHHSTQHTALHTCFTNFPWPKEVNCCLVWLLHFRSKLSELLKALDAAHSEADVQRQQLRAKEQELEGATLQLADEQARVAALRAELGGVEKEKSAEVEARLRSMQELSTALAVSQAAC